MNNAALTKRDLLRGAASLVIAPAFPELPSSGRPDCPECGNKHISFEVRNDNARNEHDSAKISARIECKCGFLLLGEDRENARSVVTWALGKAVG